jgi:hypothetical protein
MYIPAIRIAAKMALVRFTLQPSVALIDQVSSMKINVVQIQPAFWSNYPRQLPGSGSTPSPPLERAITKGVALRLLLVSSMAPSRRSWH